MQATGRTLTAACLAWGASLRARGCVPRLLLLLRTLVPAARRFVLRWGRFVLPLVSRPRRLLGSSLRSRLISASVFRPGGRLGRPLGRALNRPGRWRRFRRTWEPRFWRPLLGWRGWRCGGWPLRRRLRTLISRPRLLLGRSWRRRFLGTLVLGPGRWRGYERPVGQAYRLLFLRFESVGARTVGSSAGSLVVRVIARHNCLATIIRPRLPAFCIGGRASAVHLLYAQLADSLQRRTDRLMCRDRTPLVDWQCSRSRSGRSAAW